MSVLRKRSSWVIPAASLMIGVMALGLAGCGGDDTGFPDPINNVNPVTVPAPIPQQSAGSATITAAGGGTINAGGATVTVPPGSVSGDVTVGIAPVTGANQSLPRARQVNANAGPGLNEIAEFQIGTVNADGTVNTNCIEGTISSLSIQLTPTQAADLQTKLNTGSLLQLRQIVNGQLVFVTGVSATLNSATGVVTVTANPALSICGQYVILTADPRHPQFNVGG